MNKPHHASCLNCSRLLHNWQRHPSEAAPVPQTGDDVCAEPPLSMDASRLGNNPFTKLAPPFQHLTAPHARSMCIILERAFSCHLLVRTAAISKHIPYIATDAVHPLARKWECRVKQILQGMPRVSFTQDYCLR